MIVERWLALLGDCESEAINDVTVYPMYFDHIYIRPSEKKS